MKNNNFLSSSIDRLKQQYGIKNVIEIANSHAQFHSDDEVEKAIIGNIVLNNKLYWDVADILKPEMFSDERYRIIYECITELLSKSIPVDVLSLCNNLVKNPNFGTETFGYSFVALVSDGFYGVKPIQHHAVILLQLFIKRNLHAMLASATQLLDIDPIEAIEFVNSKIFDIENIYNTGKQQNAEILTDKAYEIVNSYHVRHKNVTNGITPGITTGFDSVDRKFGYIESDDLVIIAARPSVGKTSFALSAAINIARRGIPVAFFSIESSSNQITTKIASNILNIPYSDIVQCQIDNEEQYNRFINVGSWSNLPLYIDDTVNLSPMKLISKLRRLMMIAKIEIIFIDYVQKMQSDQNAFSRNDELGLITGALKSINKKYKIPVVALAQLNRNNETRGDFRPRLSDLRSSGEIEQDADKIFFIHREAYYDTELKTERIHDVELICAKNRNYATDSIQLKFDSHVTRFYDEPEQMPF